MKIEYFVLPEDGQVAFALKEEVKGVTVSAEGLVTLEANVANKAKFTVVASIGDKSDEITFTVLNDNTVYVYDQEDLAAISQDLYGTYILMNDITLTGVWTPIGYADGAPVDRKQKRIHGYARRQRLYDKRA